MPLSVGLSHQHSMARRTRRAGPARAGRRVQRVYAARGGAQGVPGSLKKGKDNGVAAPEPFRCVRRSSVRQWRTTNRDRRRSARRGPIVSVRRRRTLPRQLQRYVRCISKQPRLMRHTRGFPPAVSLGPAAPARYRLKANRVSTPMAAASGTATKRPTKPNKYPNANNANITHTGFKCLMPDEPHVRLMPEPNDKLAESPREGFILPAGCGEGASRRRGFALSQTRRTVQHAARGFSEAAA